MQTQPAAIEVEPATSVEMDDEGTTPATMPVGRARPGKAKRVALLLSILAVGGAGASYLLHRGVEATDDAQVEGHIVTMAPRISGQIAAVLVRDNQLVQAGDVLLELDHRELDAKLAVARADLAAAQALTQSARAQLAIAERTSDGGLEQARGGISQAQAEQLRADANIAQGRADVESALSRSRLVEADLRRATALFVSSAIPGSERDSRQQAYDDAVAAVDHARARLRAAEAGHQGTSGAMTAARGKLRAADTRKEQLEVMRAAVDAAEARAQQAKATEDLAALNLSYASLRAPVRGVVARRTVEPGQMVSPERGLITLVATDDLWVVANFKEDQLGEIRPGQSAHIAVDTFSGRRFAAHVDSIAGASGARFALIPPDNASGNFIKVVQRISVLVRFDAAPDAPLRPGMSAVVQITTR